jgi:hypothetical protein
MKALASAIFAAAILVAGSGELAQVWAGSKGGPPVKGRAWGGRPGWYGPRVWWGGGFWPGYAWGPRPWWGPGWYGYPAYPYTYYPSYPYASPPVVVQPSPQTYIQQGPPAGAAPPAVSYWYYCAESRAYYPYVKDCPEGWMTVVPPSSSPGPEPGR